MQGLPDLYFSLLSCNFVSVCRFMRNVQNSLPFSALVWSGSSSRCSRNMRPCFLQCQFMLCVSVFQHFLSSVCRAFYGGHFYPFSGISRHVCGFCIMIELETPFLLAFWHCKRPCVELPRRCFHSIRTFISFGMYGHVHVGQVYVLGLIPSCISKCVILEYFCRNMGI